MAFAKERPASLTALRRDIAALFCHNSRMSLLPGRVLR
ncbi:hypothetical protein OCAR_4691 [Afipia carboxidovorans OM5]|nr:hypothetical protein OCAR_4691 [Afipia carboxidovorans OM5]